MQVRVVGSQTRSSRHPASSPEQSAPGGRPAAQVIWAPSLLQRVPSGQGAVDGQGAPTATGATHVRLDSSQTSRSSSHSAPFGAHGPPRTIGLTQVLVALLQNSGGVHAIPVMHGAPISLCTATQIGGMTGTLQYVPGAQIAIGSEGSASEQLPPRGTVLNLS